MSLVEELKIRKSFKAMRDILKLPGFQLTDFQCVDTLVAINNKQALLKYDTGMGKTIVACAIMKCLKKLKPDMKFVFFGKNTQLLQTPAKLREYSGLSVLEVSAKSDDVFGKVWGKRLEDHDILFLTYETLLNKFVMSYLYTYRWMFSCIFVDEIHTECNFRDSSRALRLRAVLRNFEYRYGLTATPITGRSAQLAEICHMLDWESFPDIKTMNSELKNEENIMYRRPELLIVRTRVDEGMETKFNAEPVFVEPMPHQVGANGRNLFQTCKGEGAVRQAEVVREIILNNRPFKGLVYINFHEIREWLLPFLDQVGIRYGCINGKVSNNERKSIVDSFVDNKLDVVITSVTDSLDLECDYVIFMQYCTDMQQMLGRAHRTMNPKAVDLYFIFTKQTAEASYFLEFIYKRQLFTQLLFKDKDSVLIELGKELQYLE